MGNGDSSLRERAEAGRFILAESPQVDQGTHRRRVYRVKIQHGKGGEREQARKYVRSSTITTTKGEILRTFSSLVEEGQAEVRVGGDGTKTLLSGR